MFLPTSIRNSIAQLLVTNAGANATVKYYDGVRPANGGAISGNTLLATVTFGANIGTVSNGSLDWDEAGITQNSATFINGTPTWFRLESSGSALVADFDIPGDGAITGSIANGTDITFGTWITDVLNAS